MVTYTLAAGAVAATPIPGSVGLGQAPGRCLGAMVNTSNTGIITLYDNATTNSGNILGVIPGSSAVGTFVALGPGATKDSVFGMPYFNGITISQAASSPGITVLYAPGVPADGRPAG